MDAHTQLTQAEPEAVSMRQFADCDLLPCVTTPIVKQAELWCNTGLPEHRLMLRAGVACANWLVNRVGKNHRLLIVCGGGNNGGDGLVCAAMLYWLGYRVEVMMLAQSTTQDAVWANLLAIDTGVKVNHASTSLPAADYYVDALVGRGMTGALRPELADLVRQLNITRRIIASIDMPTGWGSELVVAAQHILSMLAVDPAIGEAKNDAQLLLNGDLYARGWFADLGVADKLAAFNHTRLLAPISSDTIE